MHSTTIESAVLHTHDDESEPIVLIDPRSEDPVRAALLGLEGLEGHARRLAAACAMAPPKPAGSPLLGRFFQNERAC